MTRIIRLCGPPALFLALALVAADLPAANPLHDSFTRDAVGQPPSQWTLWMRDGAKTTVTVTADGDNRAVQLTSTGQPDFSFNFKPRLPVTPELFVRFSCRVRSDAAAPGASTLQLMGFRDGQRVHHGFASQPLKPGPEWQTFSNEIMVPDDVDAISMRVYGHGECDLLLDDFTVEPLPERRRMIRPPLGPRKVDGFAAARVEETLDRGLVALPLEDGGVYLSWRLLKDDPPEIGFDVFSVTNGEERRLNDAPVAQTTDFVVPSPASPSSVVSSNEPGARYLVRPAAGFVGKAGEAVAIMNPEERSPYVSYKLSDPKAMVNKVGIGDLTGDGRYDFVVRHGDGNVDPWYLYWEPSKKPFKLEAITADGKILWTRDLTFNIESGIWYSPFIVYDVNGDGKAEVILKASDPAAGDLRIQKGPDRGKVVSGVEYLMVLNGETGEEIARAPWPDRDHFAAMGNAYNYYSRNQLAVAYLDGRTPCILALRGTYNLMLVEAWQLKDDTLEALWTYNSSDHGPAFHGQGAHSTRTVDLDGDGRDEIILGGAVLDDDGSPLWSTGRGHPDFVYVTDVTPANPGLEVVTIYETPCPDGGGFTCADGRTGRVLWALDRPSNHIHFGYGGDIDPAYRGWEIGGSDTTGGESKHSALSRHYAPDGELLRSGEAAPFTGSQHFVYWDADLQREVLQPVIAKFDGGPAGGGYAGRFLLQADILGDWREEILTAIRGELRVYSTTIPAMDRRVCLMQDPNYRQTVAHNAMGYVYDPALLYLPTSVSPNVNLTFREEDPPLSLTSLSSLPSLPSLRVVVSAPLDRPLRGELTLEAEGVEFDTAVIPVDLPPGGMLITVVAIRALANPGVWIFGTLRLDDGSVLKVQTPAGTRPPPVATVEGVRIGAEEFIRETGGQVRVRGDRIHAQGQHFSHWDRPGHALTWRIRTPESGRYRLALRYACMDEAERRFALNGKPLGDAVFRASGGRGDDAMDWRTQTVSVGGEPLVLALEAGEAELTVTNLSGSLNLNYMELIPVR